MPGDKVNIEVYAKYYDPSATNDAGLASLMNAIISGINVPAGTFVDGAGYGLSTNLPFTPGWGAKAGTGAPPMAYLNWMVFDRDYSQDLGRSGYMRITTNAKETGNNATHDKLFSPEITITQPGYVYIWLSNENPTPVEVYFDDLKVTQVKSPVIQQDDYYPFGLTFNSYSRENSAAQDFKYNGKEEQTELGLGWLDYGARMYQPELGRFFTQDRFAEKYFDFTPYQYGANSPMNFVDINGDSLAIPMSGQSTIDSMDDLMSLVAGTGVGISAIEGNVTLNFGDMTKEQIAELKNSNEGVKLLSNLISAMENYLYEAGTKEQARDRDTGESFGGEEDPKNGKNGGAWMIRNFSTTPRNVDGGTGTSDYTVDAEKNGKQYNGHVRITNKRGEFYQQFDDGTTRTIQRASVVFHELAESYGRTTLCMPYERSDGSGAHQYAINREGGTFGNLAPGNARFREKKP
jgi:RHS repeat-associated protein